MKFTDLTIEELIQICRDRNEMDFLFDICKMCAEADSIGEGYGYCNEYRKELFNNAEKHIQPDEYKKRGYQDEYCPYLQCLGIEIYRRYLKQIKAI